MTVRDPRAANAEPITSLDERYIASSIMYDAMTASVTLFLDATTLRDETGAVDQSAIRSRIDAASWSAPALRKRLKTVPFGLSSAAWIPVDRLDLDYHIRFHPDVIEEAPHTIDLFAGRALGPLDRRHPVWRVLFIELTSGDVALVFSWHHVMGDASYGIQTLRLLFDPAPSPTIRLVTASQRQSLGRAPESGAALLTVLASTWWNAHPTLAERWNAYRSRPFRRRVRRWAARIVRPARDQLIKRTGGSQRFAPRVSRLIRFDLAESQRHATLLGGSLNDLTVAAAITAVLESRPELEEASVLVPISRRRRQSTGGARNEMSAVRVNVPAGLRFADVVDTVRTQVRRAAVSDRPDLAGPRVGYATMVPSGETDRYFGTAPIRAVAGWPAGDPRDDIGVLATSYADTLTIAMTTAATTDIDALAASISSRFGRMDAQ